ncbi:probable carotene biosynthesis-related protein CBR, chloroplastic [Coccomyxa sp. Obi]|nr:probable carotene biosynthesis-related protein CBR, chloroplastic [Coccomyxa sp. Obi]
MKSLGQSSGQQVGRINDQLAASTSQPSLSPSLPIQPSIPRSYNVPLFDALKFNGPAPEVINCRLAMVGFLYAASNEASSGKLVLEQFRESPWFPLAFSAIFIWASLVPITKGAKRESFGWFSPKAELTNGRTACLAFAVLLLLEYKSGVAFF